MSRFPELFLKTRQLKKSEKPVARIATPLSVKSHQAIISSPSLLKSFQTDEPYKCTDYKLIQIGKLHQFATEPVSLKTRHKPRYLFRNTKEQVNYITYQTTQTVKPQTRSESYSAAIQRLPNSEKYPVGRRIVR